MAISSRERIQIVAPSCLTKTLERLIIENNELRQTAANLVLQTTILRESLTNTKVNWPNLGRSSS
jgi:hypothetical protein